MNKKEKIIRMIDKVNEVYWKEFPEGLSPTTDEQNEFIEAGHQKLADDIISLFTGEEE